MSTGSQDALCKALEMSLEEGDPVLVQEPIYPGTAAIVMQNTPRKSHHFFKLTFLDSAPGCKNDSCAAG